MSAARDMKASSRLVDVLAQLQLAPGLITVTKLVSDVGVFEALASFAGRAPTNHIGPDGAYRMFELRADGALITVINRRAP